MQVSMTQLRPELTGTCGACGGTFESCRCSGGVTIRIRAGIVDDIESEDNSKGYEPDDLAVFHQLVRHLVHDGDQRAAAASRRARRTLAEMVPGIGLPAKAADDACPICGYWTCRCGSAPQAVAR
ncbi:hypothetical protein [Streptomyces sp. NPDC050600]|uniref:hypothetical protein n=1 Tax=Streptomyces sp. NPDC050600 TaxID=3157213 RepID=UPI0034361B25